MSRETLQPILADLRAIKGVEAVAVVSRDGLLLAADVPNDVHGETFAIMSATMLGAAITANSELNKNMPHKVVVHSEDGHTTIAGAGANSLLVVATRNKNDPTTDRAIESAVGKIKLLD